MGKFRVSVAGLMALVALFGLEFAALRAGSQLWFSVVYSLTVLLLLFASVASRYRRGDARAFWFGFAVFGWGHLLLVLGTGRGGQSPMGGNGNHPVPPMLTARLVDTSLYLIRGNAPVESEGGLGGDEGSDGVTRFAEQTTKIAHLMMTLGVAVLGGLVAVALRGRRAKPQGGGGGARGPALRDTGRASTLLLSVVVTGVSLLAGSAAYVGARTLGPYFPERVFHKEVDRNGFTVQWYSKHLEAMREPSLWASLRADPGATAYRLLWLPSFHHPACVRVVRTGDGATLRLVILDGLGGYEPGHIALDRTVKLSRDQWGELERRFDRLKFWNLPTTVEDDTGSDGDQMILEAVAGGKYHITDRWLPEPEYLEHSQYIIDLAQLPALRKALDGYHTPIQEPTTPVKRGSRGAAGSSAGSGFR